MITGLRGPAQPLLSFLTESGLVEARGQELHNERVAGLSGPAQPPLCFLVTASLIEACGEPLHDGGIASVGGLAQQLLGVVTMAGLVEPGGQGQYRGGVANVGGLTQDPFGYPVLASLVEALGQDLHGVRVTSLGSSPPPLPGFLVVPGLVEPDREDAHRGSVASLSRERCEGDSVAVQATPLCLLRKPRAVVWAGSTRDQGVPHRSSYQDTTTRRACVLIQVIVQHIPVGRSGTRTVTARGKGRDAMHLLGGIGQVHAEPVDGCIGPVRRGQADRCGFLQQRPADG